jgi:hypothetical protein
MKNPQITVLFIIGVVLTMAGALMKILGYEGASLLLIVGMTFNSLAALLLIVKLFRNNKNGSSYDQ